MYEIHNNAFVHQTIIVVRKSRAFYGSYDRISENTILRIIKKFQDKN